MHQPVAPADRGLRHISTNSYTWIGIYEGAEGTHFITHAVLGRVPMKIQLMRPLRRIPRSRGKYIPAGPHRNVRGNP